MSIATELTRIQQAKADIKTAIEAKGVTVPSSATIDTYDDYVSQISGGGGESWITPIPQSSYTGTSFNVKKAIMSVDVPSGITSLDVEVFSQCYNLTGVTLPNSLTSIGSYAFNNCFALSSITIPDSVTSIGGNAFMNCESLTSITVPDSVTTINNYAFIYCSGLLNIEIGSGVTSIGNQAFIGCTRLTGVTVNATTPPTLGSGAFGATNNCPIYVPSGSVEAYKSANNWSTYADRIQAIT